MWMDDIRGSTCQKEMARQQTNISNNNSNSNNKSITVIGERISVGAETWRATDRAPKEGSLRNNINVTIAQRWNCNR
jgi:hypothetical protein